MSKQQRKAKKAAAAEQSRAAAIIAAKKSRTKSDRRCHTRAQPVARRQMPNAQVARRCQEAANTATPAVVSLCRSPWSAAPT